MLSRRGISKAMNIRYQSPLFNLGDFSKVYFRNTGVFFNVNFYVCVPFSGTSRKTLGEVGEWLKPHVC